MITVSLVEWEVFSKIGAPELPRGLFSTSPWLACSFKIKGGIAKPYQKKW
jgi:hypothetical protein